MVLSYRSSTPESFQIIGTDAAGRKRSVTATKHPGDFAWQLRLQHPSGRHWEASYHGNAGIIDAMGELMNSQDAEFRQDKARGDRPHQDGYDHNRSLTDGDIPPVVPSWRR